MEQNNDNTDNARKKWDKLRFFFTCWAVAGFVYVVLYYPLEWICRIFKIPAPEQINGNMIIPLLNSLFGLVVN
jgi:hypothetical protein